MDSSHNNDRSTSRVGLVYDDRMCQHSTPNGADHPENPNRIKAIWSKLEAAGIPQRCEVFSAKEAEDRCIALVHTKKHIDLIRNISSKAYDSRRNKIAAGFNSIYLNKGSSQAAYLAAGSVIEVSERIAKGELNSAVAIVRPPGHHAEPDEAMGFCLFNNVAIAASFLLNERPELGVQKILIVDWDVHHGNGTQKMFWKDSRVLFFSVHRFDFGSFYPSGDDGLHSMVGEGLGAGYNVNVPWEHGRVGDADYFAVWDHILIPIAKAFKPDMILISGGFDAAVGDPLGGCRITPYGYSIMMKKLMEFAQGRIMMALEGGYNLDSLANSVLACVETLLENKPIVGSSDAYPFESTWRVIQAVRQELSTFWPILTDALPKDLLLTTNKTPPAELISSSDSDAEDDEWANENSESSKALPVENSVDVVESLSMLKIDEHNHGKGGHGEYFQKVHPTVFGHSPADEGVFLVGSYNSLFKDSLVASAQGTYAGVSLAQGDGDFVSSSAHMPTPTVGSVVVSLEALPNDPVVDCLVPWRSVFSKVDIWYGSFGSNMWKPRFLCYIEGGQVVGMQNPCRGSMDRSPPKEIMWKSVPHRLFFGQSYTRTWGTGGVAFLHPEIDNQSKAYMCLYKITLEQFNDVLGQENRQSQPAVHPLFDLMALDLVERNNFMNLETPKDGWYSNVVYLGTEGDLPILTMTCPFSHIELFKSGKLPLNAPSKDYMNTLVKGLVEGEQLSEEEAIAYINENASKPF